ncbi:3'(2'),5'-bisphosphate nucleotidase CysQ [Chelativorans sp. SCAU2101]|uniref:3'(2'),5'-bisphosphate nucleotidase CysQ n=1 Tax=Chelativorans petroleitrophicus TaxID=2975484 RepID=A0A9X2X882_9HYPH|nr:3'(2'),5'-bisphosphate nucleotidase CysQ [Chelativorans petroleitrophicus]MCT8990204.1 3'(2'),5'-bisphosphate nucleotidase CysQ [Chelativorans petroleitrophicus]
MLANEPVNPTDELSLIEEAAREAGAIAMRFFRREPEVWWKEGHSPVSQADLEVDQFLRRALLGARPDYGWLSEETTDTTERLSAPRTFVVDPIDGTRAFIAGKATWCVSIALVENGRAIAGVLDCPATGEVFTAWSGGGARLNGEPIAVRQAGETFAMAGPEKMVKRLPPDIYARVTPHPYVPSLAYRLAMVARGELDATFIKPASHDWDLAAADIILAEAGGSIVDSAMRRPHYAGPDPRREALAAGHGPLLQVMADVVARLQE